MNIAVILAGGVGAHAGLSIPKQFYHVGDKAVLVYTLEKFQNAPSVDQICVVCSDEWAAEVLSYRQKFNITKLIGTAKSGRSGLHSLRNGLQYLSTSALRDDLIIIHDAVRPFVNIEIIEDNICVASANGNAMVAVKCVETLVQTTERCYAEKMIPRDGMYRIQTPQTFHYGDLMELLESADLDNCEVPSAFALWMKCGKGIFFSQGSEKNIKLTYPEDIEYFRSFFS